MVEIEWERPGQLRRCFIENDAMQITPIKPYQKQLANPSTAREAGRGIGLTAGLAVTEVLRVVPSWNRPVLDAAGRPREHIAGADRIEGYDLKQRHMEVVGPKLSTVAEDMKPGLSREFVKGFAQGATAAPGTTYRLEVRVADFFRSLLSTLGWR